MALQPCRSGLARGRQLLRSTPSLRAYYSAEASAPSSSHATPPSQSHDDSNEHVPRWRETPAGMRAPVPMDFAKKAKNKIWVSNDSPHVLDTMYNRLLGPGGSKMLPEELKWLAVTHKSFDQGRRGFNDRLALLGRTILTMETTKAIISKNPMEGAQVADEHAGRRKPFVHERLTPVDNLNAQGFKDVAGKEQMFDLAQRVGLIKVLRWKPRLPENLSASGVEVVMNSAIFAIIGAVTLQHGAAVASKIVRERFMPGFEDEVVV